MPPGLGVADLPSGLVVACPPPGDADVELPAGRVRLGVADATTEVLAAGLDAAIGAGGADETDPADAEAEADRVEASGDPRVVGFGSRTFVVAGATSGQ